MASVLKKLQKNMSKLYVNKKEIGNYTKLIKRKWEKKLQILHPIFFLLDIHGISCRDIQHIVGTKYSAR